MILHIMTIVFVILKALGYIGWSWWLVFAPSIFVVTMAIIVLVGAAALTWYASKL